MIHSILRTLSMLAVGGAVLGITSFAAADAISLGDSSNWEYAYEGGDPVPDALGPFEYGDGEIGERNTIGFYNVSPAFGGLAEYELSSDGDILNWRFGAPRPGDGVVQYDVILEAPAAQAAMDREGGWGWEMRFNIPDNDHNAVPFLTGRDQFIIKLLSSDNPNNAGTNFHFFGNGISQSGSGGGGEAPLAYDGETQDSSPRERNVVANADLTDGFHTFSVVQPPASDAFALFLDGEYLGNAEMGNNNSTPKADGGPCTGACGMTIGGSDSFTRGELKIDYIRATGDGALAIPEPASMALLGVGVLMMLRRRH